jgi:vacuolar protein sorting-associated protein 13A/C
MPLLLQVDDQKWSSPLPVILCALEKTDSGAGPCIEFSMLNEATVTGGRRRMPYLTLDVPCRMQLALSEDLGWRLLGLWQSLPLGVLSRNPTSSSVPQGEAAAAAPAVDAMLIIGLLSCSDIDVRFFFRAAPWARRYDCQQYVSAAALNMLPDALDNVRLRLNGREVTDVSIRATQLKRIMQEQIRDEVFNIALGLFYGSLGYLGTSAMSQGLTVASQGLKKVAGVKRLQTGKNQPVSGVADGVMQGAGSVVQGVFKGIRGVVQKPIDGARSGGGASGFMKGLGQGIAGAVAMPVAGALDLGASTFQGFNASLTTAIHGRDACIVQRTRMQRAVAPSGAVGSWDLDRALGHALLQLTNLAPEARAHSLYRSLDRRRGSHKPVEQQLDCYFLLPGFFVAMLTDQYIMQLKSEEFGRVREVSRRTGTVNTTELSAGMPVLCLHCYRRQGRAFLGVLLILVVLIAVHRT